MDYDLEVPIPPPDSGGWDNDEIENIEYFPKEDSLDIDVFDTQYNSINYVSLTVSELKYILQKINEYKIRKQIGD